MIREGLDRLRTYDVIWCTSLEIIYIYTQTWYSFDVLEGLTRSLRAARQAGNRPSVVHPSDLRTYLVPGTYYIYLRPMGLHEQVLHERGLHEHRGCMSRECMSGGCSSIIFFVSSTHSRRRLAFCIDWCIGRLRRRVRIAFLRVSTTNCTKKCHVWTPADEKHLIN